MSYTIPTNVQTKAEAVLAVASAIADEDMGARYDGTVNTSLDVLADVLAAQDVDVPQTNAGAILALAQYAHGGGGESSTQTLTVTKASESDTVSVQTISWADYIAENYEAAVEVQPDSTEGLASTYSIPVGTMFFATINSSPVVIFFDAEMTATVDNVSIMPSIPLYARATA